MKVPFSILLLFYCSLGYSQHIWTRTNPGGGGAIATVGATADGTILVASDLSGIYRSYDKGKSFDVVGANQGLIETHVSSFGFHPTDSDVFFAGTYSGLYKTKNGGKNFKLVFPKEVNGFKYSYIEDIAISSDPDIGYVTHHEDPFADGEVYKTTDGGENWFKIPNNDFPENMHLVKLLTHKTDPNIVYALTGKTRWGCSAAKLYKSKNGGGNWVEIGSELGDILDMDLHPTDTSIIFVSTFKSNFVDNESCQELENYINEDEYAGDFYKSTNGGTTFKKISDKTGIISVGIENPDIIRLVDVLFPYDWYEDAGTWETTDGGTHWQHTGFVDNWFKGYTENQYYSMSASFNGLNKTLTKDIFNSDVFYGSFGQWAWASFDGGKTVNNVSTKEISKNHWLSTGMENINGHALDVNDHNPNIVYIGGYDIGFWYTKDHGASWARTQPDFNIYPEYSWDLGDGIIESNIAKRGAGSNVMTIISDPLRDSVVWASFSNEQFTDSSENTFAYTGLFKSTNYGEDWVLLSNGLPEYQNSIRVYGLSIDKNSPANKRTLFVTINGDVYKSIDDGFNWVLALKNGGLKFSEVDNFNGKLIYAGGENGLWKSSDGGISWEETGSMEMRKLHSNTRPDIVPTWIDWTDSDNPVYPWEGVFDIQADPNIPNRVYVTVLGPHGGLYRSDNGGEVWSQNLLPDTHMRGIAIAPKNSNIIYATSSKSYHSGGFGNSLGIKYSTDLGETWEAANEGMAFDYAGMIEVEHGDKPYVWVWSPGTGVQFSKVPFFNQDNAFEVSKKDLIYPNPANNTLNVVTDANYLKYEIYSPIGGLVQKGIPDKNKSDISNLAHGNYILKLIGNAKNTITKFIKIDSE